MGAHTTIAVLAGTTLALTVTGAAQAPREIRWHESDPTARTILIDGLVSKQLVVDGLTLAVSIRDRVHSFAVQVDLDNHRAAAVDVRPELVELQAATTSRSTSRWIGLPAVRADVLAQRVRREADSEAGAIELQGFVATTTVHEPVSVIETSPNPAALNDPTQPATITSVNTEIRVRTVPDTAAHMAAMGRASNVRGDAAREGREILAAVLHPTRLAPNVRAAGRVYYERDTGVEDVVVRVPLGTATVIIPFRADARRPLIGSKTVRFY